MTKTIFPLVILSCQLLLMRPCALSAELKVTCASPVHPILIRNEHGPIVKVIVDLPEGLQGEVEAFEFSLEGTDEVSDLQSLSLYSTGSEDRFSTETQFGDTQKPMPKTSFKGKTTLRSGRNIFGCRAS